MLRAALLGILIATGAACDKSAKPPAAQVEAAAGKVVEVTGKPTATRNGASRDLVAGAEVFRDDTIETGTDGAIKVELFHNNAMWSIQGRTARVDESAAWKLAKQAPSGKPVDHATSSAGRDAERQGAGTRVTAPGAAVATEESSGEQTTDRKERNERGGPVKQAKVETSKVEAQKGGSPSTGSPNAAGSPRATSDDGLARPEPVMAPKAPETQDAPAQVKASVESQRKELRACLGASSAPLTINIALADGVATVKVIGLADAKARACVEAIVKKLPFPVADLDTTVVIK